MDVLAKEVVQLEMLQDEEQGGGTGNKHLVGAAQFQARGAECPVYDSEEEEVCEFGLCRC